MIVGGRRKSNEEAKLDKKLILIEKKFAADVHKAEIKRDKDRAAAIKQWEKKVGAQ